MKPVIALIVLCCCAGASAQQQQPQQPPPGGEPPREHRGPPREFYDACKGKKDGDVAQATTPRGEALSGTCRMVLVPAARAGDDGKTGKAPARERPRQ